MKLVCLSDTHGLHREVKLPPGDVLVHAGDLSAHGRLDEVASFLNWFSAVGNYRHRVLIAGNHDFLFERSPALAEQLVPQNVHYLNDSGITLEGLSFWGSPVTPVFHHWAFNRSEAEIAGHWARIPEQVDVLITHGPPYGVLDQVLPERRPVGCPELAKAVRQVRPRLHVFGHIHEGYGSEEHEGTRYLNVSICNADYCLTNSPVVVEL